MPDEAALEPGWLTRQIEAAIRSRSTLPAWFRALQESGTDARRNPDA